MGDSFFSPCSCAALSGVRTGGTLMRGKYPADENRRWDVRPLFGFTPLDCD